MSRRHQSLEAIGEFGFLKRLLPTLVQGKGVIVGPGDDCAVVRGTSRLLLTTDVLVEGVHFERDWQSADRLGAKAVTVNLSDIAAMGGQPLYCLMSAGVPAGFPVVELRRLHRGAERAARRAGVSLVGGNISASPHLFVAPTVIGSAPSRALLRSGARPGDHVFVTGTLGDAAAGVQLLRAGVRPTHLMSRLIQRFHSPSARLAAGARLASSQVASAMIDVSDGLAQDLDHICEQSDVGAVIVEAQIPLSAAYRAVVGDSPALALGGGEDYELLFTVPPRRLSRLHRLLPHLRCRARAIGHIVARPKGVRLQDRSGRLLRAESGGHDHFAQGAGRRAQGSGHRA